jgi:dethiobiotin synthetase
VRGIFVTGTGTEVGKTVVASAIARTLAAEGRRVAVFKPALTGLEEEGEPDHALLRRAAGSQQSDEEIAPYRFDPPASPHLAAALAGEEIEPERLVAAARAAAASASSPGLGTINHTLLTIEAARAAELRIAAVVLTPWPDDPGPVEESNRETIAALGRVEVETLAALDLRNPSSWPALAPLPPA